MKLKKRHCCIISIGGVILLLGFLLFYFIANPGGVAGLDPEDYKDNPELYELVKKIKKGESVYIYSFNEKRNEDLRFFDVCITVTEDEPSYFEFISKKLSFKDLQSPSVIPNKWEMYYEEKTYKHGKFIGYIAFAQKENKNIYPLLIKYLNSEWSNYRNNAAKALGELKDRRAFEELVNALKYDKDSRVRGEAASALGELQDKRVLKPLIEALEDKDLEICEEAARALGKIGDKQAVEPLIKTLENKIEDAHNTTWTLAKSGDNLEMEPSSYANDNVRVGAICALGELGDKRAVEPLIKSLKENNEEIREETVNALGKLKDKRAVEPLIKALNDREEYVQRKAARALGKLGDKRAVEPLLKALNDKDNNVRIEVAWALGMLEDKRVIKDLLPLVEDKNVSVRIHAAGALHKLGNEKGYPVLIKSLNNENDGFFRSFSIHVLCKLKDKRAIPDLEKRLKIEQVKQLRYEIKEALKELKTSSDKDEDANPFATFTLLTSSEN